MRRRNNGKLRRLESRWRERSQREEIKPSRVEQGNAEFSKNENKNHLNDDEIFLLRPFGVCVAEIMKKLPKKPIATPLPPPTLRPTPPATVRACREVLLLCKMKIFHLEMLPFAVSSRVQIHSHIRNSFSAP